MLIESVFETLEVFLSHSDMKEVRRTLFIKSALRRMILSKCQNVDILFIFFDCVFSPKLLILFEYNTQTHYKGSHTTY